MTASERTGVKVFGTIWIGQVVSILGTSLTDFGLGVWIYQQTGSVTDFSLIALAALLPQILFSQVAGVLIDRWDRRVVMILADGAAMLATLTIGALAWSDRLEVWHIYLLVLFSSIAQTFQIPALSSSIVLLVPKRHLTRANGFHQMGEAIALVLAPMLAGLLIVAIDLWGLIIFDLLAGAFGILMLILVRIPRPRAGLARESRRPWRRDLFFGLDYIYRRRPLFALLLLFAGSNFVISFVGVLFTPLILSFATADVMGVIMSIAFLGMMLGGLVMSLWGGPRRRVPTVLTCLLLQGIILFAGGVEPNRFLVGAAAFLFMFASPIIHASTLAIWQTKVPAAFQGRVFATRSMIGTLLLPISYLSAGPLADRVFNPLLAWNGAWAGTAIGDLVGVGPGRGIGFMFVVLGVLGLVVVGLGFSYRPLRELEALLPDAESDPADTASDRERLVPSPVS